MTLSSSRFCPTTRKQSILKAMSFILANILIGMGCSDCRPSAFISGCNAGTIRSRRVDPAQPPDFLPVTINLNLPDVLIGNDFNSRSSHLISFESTADMR